MDEKQKARNYIKSVPASGERTVRVEVIGAATPEERSFLDGCAFLMAGTLSKGDTGHTVFVSELMAKLVKRVVAQMKRGEKGE